MVKDDTFIVDELYPMVSASLDKNMPKYKRCIGNFIDKRSTELYAPAPYTRIYYNTTDAEEFYQALNIGPKTIKPIIEKTYYWNITPFNPAAAKDELTILLMMVIRYFYMKKMTKDLEMAMVYLAFSGKFYPSIHYGSFKTVQPIEYKHVMDYVVNNMLTAKYDIKQYGSVMGAIRSICNTWLKTYEKQIKSSSSEDIVYLIQQLHTRIKSFMKNIASLYYKAYEDKDKYISFDSDDYSEDNYHMADNDSLRAERTIETAINYITSNAVNRSLCKSASDNNVRVDEVNSIIDSIVSDNKNIPEIRELIRLMVYSYYAQSKTKDVADIDFITFSIAPKPNTKNKDIIRQKEIVGNWLEDNSVAYRRRKLD